jgi:hypothetical protein
VEALPDERHPKNWAIILKKDSDFVRKSVRGSCILSLSEERFRQVTPFACLTQPKSARLCRSESDSIDSPLQTTLLPASPLTQFDVTHATRSDSLFHFSLQRDEQIVADCGAAPVYGELLFLGIPWPVAILIGCGYARFGCAFSPSDCQHRSAYSSRWRTFNRCRVRSRETPTSNLESFPETVTHAAGIGPRRRWAMWTAHPSSPADALRNHTEAVNSLELPPGAEEAKVPLVLSQVAEKAETKKTRPGSHCSGCGNETTQSDLGLSSNCSTDRVSIRYWDQ